MNDPDYEILHEHTVARYVRGRPDLASSVDVHTLDVREVGDGNLNLVFVCRDARGASIVLKQSLPYVRVAGPSWPLTADRSHAEARGLRTAAEASPGTSPQLFGYDPEQHVLAMQDLSHLTVLRAALNDGHTAPGAVADCARHVARLLFHTGGFTRTPHEHRELIAASANPALCGITEALVFEEPFEDHANNRFDLALGPQVRTLRADDGVRGEVARLRARFANRPETLVHGDLHTGSVMVGVDADGTRRTVVIDPEFCFYGPVAFDLGTLLANVLLATARASSLGRTNQCRWLTGLPGELWDAFADEFWTLWTAAPARTITAEEASTWLEEIAHDTVGFAGCEAVRRVVGFAKVTDIEALEPALHRAAATMVLETAHGWLGGHRHAEGVLSAGGTRGFGVRAAG